MNFQLKKFDFYTKKIMEDKVILELLKHQKKVSIIEYRLLKDFLLLQKKNPKITIEIYPVNIEIIKIHVHTKRN